MKEEKNCANYHAEMVAIEKATKNFGDIQKDLEDLGNEIGVQVKAQKEEIFQKMHRL